MKPYWTDHCKHNRPKDKHIGILSLPTHGVYDVYVYQDNALTARVPDMHVCLRYGEEERQYLSPGPVKAFLTQEWDPASVYAIAAAMIRAETFGSKI